MKIKKISIENDNFPSHLKKIPNPPKVLYFKGNFIPEETRIAIVGTRRNSAYGKQVALSIASDLAKMGITVVSGMAPGIDTFSHTACVNKGKRTIAVLGTGIDRKSIYPKSNLELSEKIIKTGGCLISEFPPGTRGTRFTFPKRNRIISGLSLGTLVVEAKKKSGSLITANWTLKQQKKLFAVPGSIYSSNSKGVHSLIKRGAKLVESTEDILKELNLTSKIRDSKINPSNRKEKLIINTLKKGPLHVDQIIKKSGLKPSVVSTTLSLMESSNKARELGGGKWALKKI